MKLLKSQLPELAKKVMEDAKLKEERRENKRRYMMFNGKTKEVVREAIVGEFKKPETINELMARLVPLNIMQKVINKLSGVYKEAPLRTVLSKDEKEIQYLNSLEDALELNMRMKEANRFFKMNKKALLELYLDDDGVPSLRVLPAHTYECLAIKKKKKSVPNLIVKIDEEQERLIFWTDESHWVTNLKGEVIAGLMAELDNEEGENPYGILPFEFINESSSSVHPIQDDDLLAVSIAIPVILTDLLFGLKYQCWSIIYTIGKVGDIPFNPNSVIQLDFGEDGQIPSLNTVKPDIDSDKLLNVVMALVSLILTTKNLSVGSITDGITAQAAASGLAKMLDSAESVEDKKDQQAYFLKAEMNIFKKLIVMLRYWKEGNELNTDYDFDLPEDFRVSVSFQDPRPLMTEGELIDNSSKKVDKGFSTIKRELQKLYPDMDKEDIDKLYLEILDEKARIAALIQAKLSEMGNSDGVQSQA